MLRIHARGCAFIEERINYGRSGEMSQTLQLTAVIQREEDIYVALCADSGGKRPPIPNETGHVFRAKSATHSGLKTATFRARPEWVADLPEQVADLP